MKYCLLYTSGIFDVVAGIADIVVVWDDDFHQQFIGGQGHLAHPLIPLGDGDVYKRQLEHSVHITAEDTNHCKENTFAFGCCFAEVEVDIPVGKVDVYKRQ